jgi:hypothetical protein
MNKTVSSVSALIALSASMASAEIRAAPFPTSGLDITNGFTAYLDMDGDSNDDFYVNSPGTLVGVSGEVVVDDTNSMQATRFAAGADIGSSETTYYYSHWTNWIGLGRSYAGVKLVVGSETNWGWIEFYLPDSSTGWVVRGAWETVPDKSITAGAWPGTVIPSNGPYAGGNTVIITNSNFSTITNVTVGGVAAAIQDSGTNWVKITMPATGSVGVKDIIIQTDYDDLLLVGAYTVNPLRGIFDFDGDGITDIGIYRAADNLWHVVGSSQGRLTPFSFGAASDVRVPADYDGDGLCDFAVFRPSTATWYIFGTATGPWSPMQYGMLGDLPIPADYDGDGKADFAVLRPTSMTWYIYGSSAGPRAPFVYGAAGDWPIPADYDGDGLADPAVLRPSTMTWYAYGTSVGPIQPVQYRRSGDIPLIFPR